MTYMTFTQLHTEPIKYNITKLDPRWHLILLQLHTQPIKDNVTKLDPQWHMTLAQFHTEPVKVQYTAVQDLFVGGWVYNSTE